MSLMSFLGEMVTSLLVGYLTFTSGLAHSLERALPLKDHVRTEISHEQKESPVTNHDGSKGLSTIQHGGGVIPRVLLENKAFQQAALIASDGYDVEVEIDESIPLEKRVEDALVNIFCQYKTKDYIRTTTGTGFFIDTKGVILTNAHVAQFLLLKEVDDSVIDARCVVRGGNPATPKYEAELLYLPPAWIMQNATLITEETPRGTGERDYALLYVSKTTTNEPLPTRFPALPIDTELLPRSTTGQEVLTAGYPAESLIREGSRALLYPKVASTTVGELYTFGSNFADIFEVSESPVGEQGASGGPIVRSEGSALGLIVTKGDESQNAGHRLRALTLSYIDRTITDETGYSIRANMRGDIAFRGKVYNQALVPFLRDVLTKVITVGDE